MKTYIYKIKNKINGKCYIGVTTNLKRRRRDHELRNINSAYKDKKLLYRAIKKYGAKNFSFKVIFECDDFDYAVRIVEPKLIKKYKSFGGDGTGYNATRGGEGILGYKFSKEACARARIERKARFLRPEYMAKYKGRKLSEIQKKRIGESVKQEWLRRGGNPLKGRTRSKEANKKTSETLRKMNFKPSINTIEANRSRMSKRWLITHPCGKEEEVLNLSAFCRLHNLCNYTMRTVSLGKMKHHKDFKCKLLDPHTTPGQMVLRKT